GGGISIHLGSVLTVSNSRVDHNRAIGGDGGLGGNGEDGQGGGVFVDAQSSLTLMATTIDRNLAIRGGGRGRGSQRAGGRRRGAVACGDALRAILANHARPSNDAVFGILNNCYRRQ